MIFSKESRIEKASKLLGGIFLGLSLISVIVFLQGFFTSTTAEWSTPKYYLGTMQWLYYFFSSAGVTFHLFVVSKILEYFRYNNKCLLSIRLNTETSNQ